MPFVEPFTVAESGGGPVRAWPPALRLVPADEDTAPRAVVLDLCGVRLTHTTLDGYHDLLRDRLGDPAAESLLVGSVNLDHLHHFGRRGRRARPAHRRAAPRSSAASGDRWLLLADGAPISARATALTGAAWPRLAGADLLPSSLDVAVETGATVGFLGGTDESAAALRSRLEARWPGLRLAGVWTPDRADLVDDRRSSLLADQVRRAGVDLLVVGLGKPLQEEWIDQHGDRTGARVLTAFGGAADFLGGTTRRAPRWMRAAGCEWLFRLLSEPRRLSRRYLAQGPVALLRLLADRPGPERADQALAHAERR